MPQLLSLRATTMAAGVPKSLRSTREATAVRNRSTTRKSSPGSPQLEKVPVQSDKDPAQPEDKNIGKIYIEKEEATQSRNLEQKKKEVLKI